MEKGVRRGVIFVPFLWKYNKGGSCINKTLDLFATVSSTIKSLVE